MYLIHARLRRLPGPADPADVGRAAARHVGEMSGVEHTCVHPTRDVDSVVLSVFVRSPTIETAESRTRELCARLLQDRAVGDGWEAVTCWAGMVDEYYERLASPE